MYISAQNLMAARFLPLTCESTTDMRELYAALTLPTLLDPTKSDDGWLDTFQDPSSLTESVESVLVAYFDPAQTKHRPFKQLLSPKQLGKRFGMSIPRATLLSYLLSKLQIGGFDLSEKFKELLTSATPTAGVPTPLSASRTLGFALCAKFYDEIFVPSVQNFLTSCSALINQGSTLAGGKKTIWYFDENTINAVMAQFSVMTMQWVRAAKHSTSIHVDYRAAHYLPHLRAALVGYYFVFQKNDFNESIIEKNRDSIQWLSAVTNFSGEVTNPSNKGLIAAWAKQRISEGTLISAVATLRRLVDSKTTFVRQYSGKEVIANAAPLRTVPSTYGSIPTMRLSCQNAPIAFAIDLLHGRYGTSVLPVPRLTEMVTGSALAEFNCLVKEVEDLRDCVFGIQQVSNQQLATTLKSFSDTLAALPHEVLFDALLSLGNTDTPVVRGVDGELSFVAALNWQTYCFLRAGDTRIAPTSGGRVSSKRLHALMVAVLAQEELVDADINDSCVFGALDPREDVALDDAYLGSEHPLKGAPWEYDSDLVDSLLKEESPDSTKYAEWLETRDVIWIHPATATAMVWTPSNFSQELAGGKVAQNSKSDETIPTEPIDDYMLSLGLPTLEPVAFVVNRQARLRINRLKSAVASLQKNQQVLLASSSVRSELVALVKNMTLRARGAAKEFAKALMLGDGVSFNLPRHNTAYRRQLNSAVSATSLSIYVAAIRLASPELADVMESLQSLATTGATIEQIDLFDVGEI